MKVIILAGVVLFFSLTAEAAYIPAVPQCRVLATHTDVAECFGALNSTSEPDKTKCGPLDVVSIIRGINDNNSLAGSTWMKMGFLALNQCEYAPEVKELFLSLERMLFGGPEPREKTTAAWRRQICIKADRDRLGELSVDEQSRLYMTFVGETYFGGGTESIKRAEKHMLKLFAGRDQAELDRLASEFLEHRVRPCL